jgi:hypothetical protein
MQKKSTKSTTRLATAGGADIEEFIFEKLGGTPKREACTPGILLITS